MAGTSVALDAFDKFNSEAGFSQKEEPFIAGRSQGFDDDLIKNLENKVGAIIPKGVDTKPAEEGNVDADDLPEYWQPYKDLISKGFDVPEDKTNYSQLAVQKFGSEYSHLNSPEAVYDEAFYQEEGGKYLSNNPRFVEAQQVLDKNAVSDADLVRKVLREKMDADPITFSRRMFDERIAELFDEEGLTEDGKRMANSFRNHYKTEHDRIVEDAKRHAKDSLNKEKEYRNVLNQTLETFSPMGIELPEDMKAYLKQAVTRNMANPPQPKTPEERAEYEINKAIVSDKKLLATILRAADKRGFETGKNSKFKSKF